MRDCRWQYNQFVANIGPIYHSIHVMALMGLREEYERSGKPLVSYVDLFREKDPRQVMAMEHEDGTLKYHARPNKTFPWSWKAMVWSLGTRTREKYAGGGIIAFWFAPREEIDILREVIFGPGTFVDRPKVWDFYITRADGATHRFRPDYGGITMELCIRRPDSPPPEGFEQMHTWSKSYYPQKGRAESNAEEKAKAAHFTKNLR